MTLVPVYAGPAIADVSSLAHELGLTETDLRYLALDSQRHYHRREKTKSSGGKRVYYQVDTILKTVQSKINDALLSKVTYPAYVRAVRDSTSPRDYVSDANLHAGKTRCVLKYDVRDFYHSVNRQEVLNVWKAVFGASDDVAELLADLTTLKDFVPQGAPTSPNICNLVFREDEREVSSRLGDLGLRYSRYVDDITVSARTSVSPDVQFQANDLISAMLRKHGLVENATKRKRFDSSGPMNVHGLNVNSGIATVPRKRRSDLRSAVHHFCRRANELGECEASIIAERNRLRGRLADYARSHPGKAAALNWKIDHVIDARQAESSARVSGVAH